MKIDIKSILIVALSIVLLCSMITCNQQKDSSSKYQLEASLAKQTIDSLTNLNGQLVITQHVIEVNNQDAIREYTDSIFNLKRKYEKKIKDIKAFYSERTTTTLDSVLVPYEDTTKVDYWKNEARRLGDDCESLTNRLIDTTVFVGIVAKDSTNEYKIEATVLKKGILINKLTIPDSQYVRFITLKGGFLKKNQEGKRKLFLKKTIQVQVLHTNKLINVDGSNSIFYIPKKKERWLEKALLIGGGIYLGTKL